MLRLSIGLFSSIMLGAMGLFFAMMNVPPPTLVPPQPGYVDVHFVGGFMMVMALAMFIVTFTETKK